MDRRNRRTQNIRYLALLIAALGTILALTIVARSDSQQSHTVIPVPQAESWWLIRHQDTLTRIRQGNVDLLLIGDSITMGWETKGRRIWNAYYSQRRAVNLGFSGDQTQHVLWRLDHGEIDGIAPKLAIVLIGTNNAGNPDNSPETTAAGIQAILNTLRIRLPSTKILLLGPLPCDPSADSPLRQTNAAVNNRISKYADDEHIYYLDLSRLFLDDLGRLSQDLMPDYLHPNERGYQVWADGMEDMIRTLLASEV